MKRTKKRPIMITGLIVLAVAMAGQLAFSQDQQKDGEKGMMSMDGMMEECREHCEETSQSIDEMMTMMKEARQSNDPAKMRAALDKAQEPLGEMKEHMSGCMHMMDMMQKMHGGQNGMKEMMKER